MPVWKYKSPAIAAAIFYYDHVYHVRIADPLAMQSCKYKSPAIAAAIFYLVSTFEALASGLHQIKNHALSGMIVLVVIVSGLIIL